MQTLGLVRLAGGRHTGRQKQSWSCSSRSGWPVMAILSMAIPHAPLLTTSATPTVVKDSRGAR